MLNNSKQKEHANLKCHMFKLYEEEVEGLLCAWIHGGNNKHGDAALRCWKKRKGRGGRLSVWSSGAVGEYNGK